MQNRKPMVLVLADPKYRPHLEHRSAEEAVWSASDGGTAFAALFNLDDAVRTLKIPAKCENAYTVQGGTELWTGIYSDRIETVLWAHGCAVFRLD